tara:strand:- start:16989 stop:18344 length:1356 start_codon:yes stop_codon:yes gene_type:complete
MPTQSQQFKITEASITADRIGGFGGNFFDVRTSVSELNIYESLDKPYLTGTVVVLDDKALFDTMDFQGTERFRVKMASVDNDLDTVFERTFIMTGIERSVKSNDNGKSSIFVFTLLDEHAFLSSLKKISKSFNGSIDDILTKLLATEMGLDIDLSYLFVGNGKKIAPIQTNMKGIIPNLHPIEAVKWLVQRATTVTGSPFFAYASMHDNNLRLGNLDSMLSQQAFNSQLPYTFNPANVAEAETQTELERTFTIKAMKTSKMANTLKLIQEGAVSSRYSNTNLNTGQIFSQHHTIRNTLSKLQQQEVIGNNQNVFDGEFKVDESYVDTFESKQFHTITSSGTYGKYKSYHDEFDATKFKKKLESKSILNHLYKNMTNVIVEGAGFIVSKAGVGDIVNIKITNDSVELSKNGGEDELVDKGKSGDHIIYDTRHTFRGTQHVVSMNLCKLERQG